METRTVYVKYITQMYEAPTPVRMLRYVQLLYIIYSLKWINFRNDNYVPMCLSDFQRNQSEILIIPRNFRNLETSECSKRACVCISFNKLFRIHLLLSFRCRDHRVTLCQWREHLPTLSDVRHFGVWAREHGAHYRGVYKTRSCRVAVMPNKLAAVTLLYITVVQILALRISIEILKSPLIAWFTCVSHIIYTLPLTSRKSQLLFKRTHKFNFPKNFRL